MAFNLKTFNFAYYLLIFNILQFFSNLSAFKRFAGFLADVGKMWGKNFGHSKD